MRNRCHQRIVAGIVIICLGALWGCPPGRDPIQVVFPEGSQDWDTNDDGQIVMLVRFSRAVDMNSLAPGENVIFNSDKVTNADLTIEPGEYADEILITTLDSLLDLLGTGAFTLLLKGDGPSPIRCVRGLPLDGDNSGESGGDFMHMYTLVI